MKFDWLIQIILPARSRQNAVNVGCQVEGESCAQILGYKTQISVMGQTPILPVNSTVLWSARSWRATRARESEGLSVMAVMLVSCVQGAEGNKGVSYYNATLWRCFVSILHVMGGGKASSLYRHPERVSRIWVYREPCVYRIFRVGLSRLYRVYRLYGYSLDFFQIYTPQFIFSTSWSRAKYSMSKEAMTRPPSP